MDRMTKKGFRVMNPKAQFFTTTFFTISKVCQIYSSESSSMSNPERSIKEKILQIPLPRILDRCKSVYAFEVCDWAELPDQLNPWKDYTPLARNEILYFGQWHC